MSNVMSPPAFPLKENSDHIISKNDFVIWKLLPGIRDE